MLSPERLLQALVDYARQPEPRKLSTEQVAWFAQPESVFMLYYTVLSLPDELADAVMPACLDWVEVATSELALTVSRAPDGTKAELEAVIAMIVNEAANQGILNPKRAFEVLTMLKQAQFDTSGVDMAAIYAEQAEHTHTEGNVMLSPEALISQLLDDIKQEEIQSGIEFIDFFEAGYALMPRDPMSLLFSAITHFTWSVDALLLLTYYHEKPVALCAAEALDGMTHKSWCHLSQRQLLHVLRRFARHPELQGHYKRWQKYAMKHAASGEVATIEQVKATHVDGIGCASVMIRFRYNGQNGVFAGLLDLERGLRDTMLNLGCEDDFFASIVDTMQDVPDTPMTLITTNSDWLAEVLPWLLAKQKEDNIDLHMLYFLSLLPTAWTTPQPFSLADHIAHYQVDISDKAVENARKMSRFIGNDLMFSWRPPFESISASVTVKSLMKTYYYAHKATFIERFAFLALLEQYGSDNPVSSDRQTAEAYWQLAQALTDPALNRKRFPLFEDLAEICIEDYHDVMVMELDAGQEETGLVLKVALLDAKPAVWRRIKVSNTIPLYVFHVALQISMGWDDAHAYLFETASQRFLDDDGDIPLGALLKQAGDSLLYRYDFGDDWCHSITLEKVMANDVDIPSVSAGRGVCPEEDCGGIDQWNRLYRLLKKAALSDVDYEWLEDFGFDPDARQQDLAARSFDKAAVNAALLHVFG
ncbi:plasmid pRiA4b ORF-3 family protein [Photobacterium japonica]|uniref:plasmid pRiA4b ORF-3 family protein n=1 Tax=Photobacterium japonica TaxID=2910235 RepID=UPI003D122037